MKRILCALLALTAFPLTLSQFWPGFTGNSNSPLNPPGKLNGSSESATKGNLLTYCLQAPDLTRLNRSAPVLIDDYDWDSGILANNISSILLTEILGYPVQFLSVTNGGYYSWSGLSSGKVMVSLEVWVMSDERKRLLKAGTAVYPATLEALGPTGQIVRPGLYVPTFAATKYPASISYRAFKDPVFASYFSINASTVSAFNLGRFNIEDTKSKALIIYISPSSGGNPFPSLISTNNLSMTIAYTGSEEKQIEVFKLLSAAGIPALYPTWDPNGFLNLYQFGRPDLALERVSFPKLDNTCNPEGATQSCDFSSVIPQKISWAGLLNYNPELYWLFRSMSIDNDAINEMLGEMLSKGVDHRTAACSWVKNHRDIWSQWIWFRSCPNNCSSVGECFFNQCKCNAGYEGEDCSIKIVVTSINQTNPFATAFIIVSAIMIVFTFFMLYVIIAKRTNPAVRNFGWLTHIVLAVGFLLNYAGSILFSLEPSAVTCKARFWLPGIGFVLVFGTLFMRSFRMNFIFRKMKMKTKHLALLSDPSIIIVVLGLAAIQCILLVLVTIFGNNTSVVVKETLTSRWVNKCASDSKGSMFDLAIFLIDALLMIASVVMAFKNRSITNRFNESKYVSFSVYNVTFMVTIFVLCDRLLTVNIEASFILNQLALVLSSLSCEAILFGRMLYGIKHPESVEDINKQTSYPKVNSSSALNSTKPPATTAKQQSQL